MPADLKSDCEKVLAAFNGAARRSRTDIKRNVFHGHRTKEQMDALGEALESNGLIIRLRVPPGDGHDSKMEVWEKASTHARTSSNGTSEQPPAGGGWLPKAKTLRRAQRGVVPAVAAREGRTLRKRDATREGRGSGKPRVSDGQRGAAYLIFNAYKSYLHQGVIEVQGDWIRLAKNPTRRPPHHWYEALLHFLAEAHPTLDGKWRRKPKKTLIGVMEDALGRKLEPGERVRRWPGAGGSWDPEDIMLIDGERRTVRTLADVRENP